MAKFGDTKMGASPERKLPKFGTFKPLEVDVSDFWTG